MLTNDRINDNNKVAFLFTYIGKTAYALLKELVYPHTPNTLTVCCDLLLLQQAVLLLDKIIIQS